MTLTVVKGPEKGRTFHLDRASTYVCGRNPQAPVSFSEADPYISRRHFLLEVSPPNVYFNDLDVTNPSRINGSPAKAGLLKDGDVIEVGYTRLLLRIDFASHHQNIHCSLCGDEVQAPAGEPGSCYCPRCFPPASTAGRKAAPMANPYRCHQCGTDLAEMAHRDGRAGAWGDRPIYCCSKCVPPRGEEAGRKIGGYVVVRRLRKGGMGRVYLVYQPLTARLLALKEMSIETRNSAARFNREIRIMQSTDHPNVISCLDHEVDPVSGRPYLVMEYLARGNLGDLLEENQGVLPVGQTLGYAEGLLRGLEHLHERGIIHRDIKPENILLRQYQDELIPKIGDFGISRIFATSGGSEVLTRAGTRQGTIFYMPPEQILDSCSVRETADIYSLGVTVYQMLTGHYPFDFPSAQEVARYYESREEEGDKSSRKLKGLMSSRKQRNPLLMVLEDEPIPLRERDPNLPLKLCQVVDRALSKRQEERHQSARDFRLALEGTWRVT